jgi:osmotically-inducible protein OsmY
MKQKQTSKAAKTARTDKRTAEDVKVHLDNHKEVDSSDVSVRVSEGSVVLGGEIDNGGAKNLVHNIVSGEVPNIKELRNEITARRDVSEAPSSPSDK